ncbi:transposase [Escherichia coli O157:H7 str. K5607]|nr:transposase [Escherichia coli O157:H7 str. K5607]
MSGFASMSGIPGAVMVGSPALNITLWLERENRELRRSNDILRQASAYFAKAEFDRLWKK